MTVTGPIEHRLRHPTEPPGPFLLAELVARTWASHADQGMPIRVPVTVEEPKPHGWHQSPDAAFWGEKRQR